MKNQSAFTAAVKKIRDDLLRRVDGIQRQLAIGWTKTIRELASHAELGRDSLELHRTVKLTLDRHQHWQAMLMRSAFERLIADAHRRTAAAIMDAARVAKTRRRRESENDPGDANEPFDPMFPDASLYSPSTGYTPPSPSIVPPPRSIFDLPPDVPTEEIPFAMLPSIPRDEALAILYSRNSLGMTWEEQLARSSLRVADPTAMAGALSDGIAAGESLPGLRERIRPFVENLSVSAQRIARTEGLRVASTAQQRAYDAADAAGAGIKAMQLHCVMGRNSATDHKARNGKVYAKKAAGQYVADDGEPYPGTPYGHPNCLCTGSPLLSFFD